MERDVLFAKQVRAQSEAAGIPGIVTDGTRTEDEIYGLVKQLLRLQ